MQSAQKLAEGKTKIIYPYPDDATLVIVEHKDGITAGDGARRHVISGKGAISGRTSANVFALLNASGVHTHFVSAPDAQHMIVRRCSMLPIEVVTRRLASGSYLKRHPDVVEASHFDPPLLEFFLKDDARHDPQISADDIIALGLASAAEVEQLKVETLRVFSILEQAWFKQQVTLVDLKIEFGRPIAGPDAGMLIVADVIDNDSWRIWPTGDKAQMLDKQVYRNMPDVTDAGLADIKARYERVASMTDVWTLGDR